MTFDEPRITPTQLAVMDPKEIGRHMSGGYGPAKFNAMANAIRDMAQRLTSAPVIAIDGSHST